MANNYQIPMITGMALKCVQLLGLTFAEGYGEHILRKEKKKHEEVNK